MRRWPPAGGGIVGPGTSERGGIVTPAQHSGRPDPPGLGRAGPHGRWRIPYVALATIVFVVSVAAGVLDMPPLAFWERVTERVTMGDLAHGLSKSFVFAWIVGFSGAHLGLQAGGDAVTVERMLLSFSASSLVARAAVLNHVELRNVVYVFGSLGDLDDGAEALQRRGLRVTVVSTIRTQPPMIADELRRQADTFLELQDLQPSIARIPHGRDDRPVRPAEGGEAENGETVDVLESV